MNRGGWTVALLLGAMALWTLLAWGVSGLLTWLPTLAEAAGNATLPVNGALSLVPQTVLDAWLPWLKQLGNGLASYFPLLLAWAGYAVWLLWGIGMLALMLLAALARRYLSAAQR
ncbi:MULTISPECIES: hypothetical protein [Serratia]|uniref:hypothetical protein n=1 Tax=Serratia TaxID=613 RepID=UPI0013DA4195|nr:MULTISPECIES: hypothetical protein [Serratia]WIF06959.1 hypothetical protein QEP77_00420 [Serratia sp. B1]MBH3320999.1 hypothetical protein [Serratia ureilytica]MCT2269408.1 hypothetical protein [Serratia ureilytica]UMK52298.1 hypothetical protein L2D49_22000 [Serratia ureilytica]BEM69517.1 hypothetical protein SME24J_35160 [Serratia marcescens]